MCKKICLILFLLATLPVFAQIKPIENDILNHLVVSFSVPAVLGIASYNIEIANGSYTTEDSFSRHIVKTVNSKNNKIIIDIPSFGTQYTWRYISFLGSSTKKMSPYFHFSTGYVREADTTLIRLRILKAAEKYKDAYIFVDAARILYDMSGHPIWYLPAARSKIGTVRDLKMSPYHTITYVIDEEGVYEVNFDGAMLWKGPNDGTVSGDSIEHYHHEFTRLNNGDYMALGQDFQYWKPSALGNLSIVLNTEINYPNQSSDYFKHPMGTLIEYDKSGKVVWMWKSSDHFDGTEIFYKRKEGTNFLMDAHENSFFFNEKNNDIYISCRNLDRIIKIKYPVGNIENVYAGGNLFCGQHSCKTSPNGFIYLFNNNTCKKGSPPTVLKIREPINSNDSLQKIWEYACEVSTTPSSGFPSGGNVVELPDQSLFVSTAFPDSKLFILSTDKRILWSAIAENWNETIKAWEPMTLYRANIILDRKELEQIIQND